MAQAPGTSGPASGPATALQPRRAHPHLYQINTWPWLDALSAAAGHTVRLADVPDAEHAGPFEAARVKWFDKGKGFGFANVFGRPEDVFIHVEVLRHSGFADLQAGEAVCLRIIEGKRGRMAVQVLSWEVSIRG